MHHLKFTRRLIAAVLDIGATGQVLSSGFTGWVEQNRRKARAQLYEAIICLVVAPILVTTAPRAEWKAVPLLIVLIWIAHRGYKEVMTGDLRRLYAAMRDFSESEDEQLSSLHNRKWLGLKDMLKHRPLNTWLILATVPDHITPVYVTNEDHFGLMLRRSERFRQLKTDKAFKNAASLMAACAIVLLTAPFAAALTLALIYKNTGELYKPALYLWGGVILVAWLVYGLSYTTATARRRALTSDEPE